MPTASISEQLPSSALRAFRILHDYDIRLEWDTLLKEAKLTRGFKETKKGTTSLCVGKPFWGLIGIETEYLTFNEGNVAAVKMINSPAFFDSFSASIRHRDHEYGSEITYKYSFIAKPFYLRWILEPIMQLTLAFETRKRLRALADYLEQTERTTQPVRDNA